MKRILILAGLAAMGALLFAAGLLIVPPMSRPSPTRAVQIGGPFKLMHAQLARAPSGPRALPAIMPTTDVDVQGFRARSRIRSLEFTHPAQAMVLPHN